MPNQTLKGTLSTQAFACAPRKSRFATSKTCSVHFRTARLLHAQPNASSPAVKIPETSGPLAFWVTNLRGDWVEKSNRSIAE